MNLNIIIGIKKHFTRIIIVFFICFSMLIISPDFTQVVSAYDYGQIVDASVDSWEFSNDTYGSSINNTIRINNTNIFATVIQNNNATSGSMNISTFQISNDTGLIQHSFIETYEFDTYTPWFNVPGACIDHLDGTDIYVVYYRHNGSSQGVKTFRIDESGDITTPYIDSRYYFEYGMDFYKMIHTGNLFIMSSIYTYDTGSGHPVVALHSYKINDSGTIDVRKDWDSGSYTIGIDAINEYDLVFVDSNTFCLVFSQYTANDGWMRTFNVSADGIFEYPWSNQWEFDTVEGNWPTLHHIIDDIYALAYSNVDGEGWIKTFRVDSTGVITTSWIDQLEFTAGTGYTVQKTNIFTINDASTMFSGNGIYGIVFSDVATEDGYICTVDINETGIISDSVVSGIERFDDTSVDNKPTITYCGEDCYLAAYNTTDNDARFTTFMIETYGSADPSILNINVFDEETALNVTSFNVLATNTDGDSYYVSSCSNTKTINITDLPKGDNVKITISASGYHSRDSSIDNVGTTYFTIDGILYNDVTYNFYLPLFSNSSLYYIQVVDEYLYPVEDAIVQIYGLVDTNYTKVSETHTDAYGYTDCFLEYNHTYLINITKSGYQTKTAYWIPDSVHHGIAYPKVFKISHDFSSSSINANISFTDQVTFSGLMYSNDSIAITYLDGNCTTTDTQIYLYELYNGTSTYLNSTTDIGGCSYTWWNHSINTSRTHMACLYWNNTANFDISDPYCITIWPINTSFNTSLNKIDIDKVITDVIGPAPSGLGSWASIISVIIAFVFLVTLGPYNTALGIMGAGVGLGLTQALFGMFFVNSMSAALIILCPFCIAIGIIYFFAKGNVEERL